MAQQVHTIIHSRNLLSNGLLFFLAIIETDMLEKPDIPDETILACLRAEYGLPVLRIAFLPIGGDLSTAVYRAVTQEETSYFCKLKRNGFDPVSVAVPAFLSEQGISEVIAPLLTRSGELWAVMEEFHLILYPFVEGTNGYELELTERQWAEFGAADRKSTRLNSSHVEISYAVFCLKKKKKKKKI